jgi:hypothetical protein
VLNDDQFVARLCRSASLDQATRQPTVASFEFRAANGEWKDTYLSVDGLEILSTHDGTIPEKLTRLREYQLGNPLGVDLIRPTTQMSYAVLSVGTIRAAQLVTASTTLDCLEEPRAAGDTHCGVHPTPGVDHWSGDPDDPAHLAVKQYLFLSYCHWERAIPIAA